MNDQLKSLSKRSVKSLKSIQREEDTESGHIEADQVLCTLLTDLGFSEVVTEYEKVKKWYA